MKPVSYTHLDDLEGKLNKLHTRFPPEPNGYLHIGHAKSICLNFGLAKLYGGKCNLRFDDTNPSKEDVEYVESIEQDVKWLGFDWDDRLYFASSYFDKFYEIAVKLIKEGKAYAVSYTHLDVYKRQCLCNTNVFTYAALEYNGRNDTLAFSYVVKVV